MEKTKDSTKIIVAAIGAVSAIVSGWALGDKIKQRNEEKKEAKEKKKREEEEKKRNGGITNDEKHDLELKEKELDLINRKKVEGFEAIQKVKQQYNEEQEPRIMKEHREAKERICRLLKIGYYCSPVKHKMLEDDEKTTAHVKPTPLIGDMIKLGDRIVIAGTPGAGKSALVHQLCYEISNGEESKLLPKGSGHSKAQLVYLFDKELDSDDRIERDGCANFNDEKLIRMDEFNYPSVYYMLSDIYDLAMDLNEDATILFDNLYAIFPTLTSEQTKDLLEGFEKIQKMTGERGIKITFIIITHTIKDASGVPEMSDIAGSANLSRFARSVYILAATKRDGESILVNTKCRHNGRKDIAVLTIAKEPMLHLEYKSSISAEEAKKLTKSNGSSNSENDVVKENSAEEFVAGTKYTQTQIEEVINLFKEGLTYRGIAKRMEEKGVKMSQTTVMNLLNSFASEELALATA